ncbi:hypothetical protein DM75_3736 [Burkholderia mallei]|nr:hypothetical protein DM75_3736 [Burkholderia mallei]
MFYASQKAGKTRTRFSRDGAPAARIIPATERFATREAIRLVRTTAFAKHVYTALSCRCLPKLRM